MGQAEKKDAGDAAQPEPAPTLMDDGQLPMGALARFGTVRFRHGSAIMALTYSKDGKSIFTTGFDTVVHVWDAASGQEQRVFRVSEVQVQAMALSQDGKTLATAGRDMQIRLSDAATGKALKAFAGHDFWI